jgi:aspartate-semialdehyde dehydrogenase
VEELTAQTHAVLHGQEPPPPAEYPHPIAFNVLGAAGTFEPGDDHTNEERKMMFETRKILGDESLRIGVTCARVPVINSHSESVTVETREDLSPEACRDLLAASPGLAILDDPSRQVYPTALGAAGRDEVFVGRIRRDPGNPRTLSMWIVSDNLRKGAATNTIQLAELLVERELLGKRAAAA